MSDNIPLDELKDVTGFAAACSIIGVNIRIELKCEGVAFSADYDGSQGVSLVTYRALKEREFNKPLLRSAVCAAIKALPEVEDEDEDNYNVSHIRKQLLSVADNYNLNLSRDDLLTSRVKRSKP